MPDRFNITVEGFDELQGTLRALGPSFQSRVFGPALGAMAAVVRRKKARQGELWFYRPDWCIEVVYRLPAYSARYGGRTYRAGRAEVFAGQCRMRFMPSLSKKVTKDRAGLQAHIGFYLAHCFRHKMSNSQLSHRRQGSDLGMPSNAQSLKENLSGTHKPGGQSWLFVNRQESL